MKVSYYPDTDSLFVKLKPGLEAEGSEVAPGIVFHYTPEGEVTAIEIKRAGRILHSDLRAMRTMNVLLPFGRSRISRRLVRQPLPRRLMRKLGNLMPNR